MTPRRLAAALTGAIACLVLAASAAQAAPLPVEYNGLTGYAHSSPTASPPGANDWSCKPSSAHPRPVVLVHGTFIHLPATPPGPPPPPPPHPQPLAPPHPPPP